MFKTLVAKGFLLLFLVLLQVSLFAQTGKIVGTVVDENGEALPGVSVYQKGEPKLMCTDINGKFIYTLSPGTYTLVFKYVAYKEKTTSVITVKENETSQVTINLVPQDDAVLTGADATHYKEQEVDAAENKIARKTILN